MAEVDFLPFAADPAANVVTQAVYADVGATWRILGFSTGTALSNQLNKAWRQSSLIASMIANFAATETGQNMIDDGSTSGQTALLNTFTSAVRMAGSSGLTGNFLPINGGTLTGPLAINAGANQLTINASTGQAAQAVMNRNAGQVAALFSETAGSIRWQLVMADVSAETGANAGSNWALSRYTDGGVGIDSPISVSRQTGIVNFAQSPTVAGGLLPYVPLGGGRMSGVLGSPTGIQFGYGSYAHTHQLYWDGTYEHAIVDGSDIGALATVNWSNGQFGLYLPLAGGTITGSLQVNGALVVNGGSGFRSSVWFANLGDFSNFTDGRTRYRQWAGSWFDAWDGQTGNRTWYCAGGQSMFLDGSANWQVSGVARVYGGRILSVLGSSAPSVCAFNTGAGVSKGFWVDGSGMWLGQMDGGGNPAASHMLIDNNGYVLIYNAGHVNGSFWADGQLGTSGAFNATGVITGGNALNVSGTISGGSDINAAGNMHANSGRIVSATASQPSVAAWSTGGSNAMGFWVDGGGMGWGHTDAGGNSQTEWMRMTSSGSGLFIDIPLYYPSDPALKTNITPAPEFDSLGAIVATPLSSFDWRNGGRHTAHGLIATDLCRTLPDVVADAGEEGAGMQHVDPLALIAHCFRALKQLDAKIEAMQTR